MTKHFEQEKFISDGFKPVRESYNRANESIEILQTLAAPDPEAPTVTAAYAGKLGETYVSGTQNYVRVDQSKIEWSYHGNEEEDRV